MNALLFRLTQLVWFAFSLLELLLLFRFLLRLLGANPESGFVDFVYDLSAPFAGPFEGMVNVWEFAGGVIEWSTLIAILVYWIAAWIVVKLVLLARPVSKMEAERGLQEEEKV